MNCVSDYIGWAAGTVQQKMKKIFYNCMALSYILMPLREETN